MNGLAARLRGFDGVALALVLVVGYVYVQALRAFVGGLVMPFFARDADPTDVAIARLGTLSGATNHYFVAGDRLFYYGGVLEWGITLGLLVITFVVLARRLGWRR